MICETCGQAPATQISTRISDGQKKAVYECAACAAGTPEQPKLDRPCEKCGQQEGTVKLVRLKDNVRFVSYICQTCANKP